MFLSLSGFLFEDAGSQSRDFESFCKLAQSAGYQGVELRNSQIKIDEDKLKRSEIKKMVDFYGLAVTCLITTGPIENLTYREELFWKYIEFCNDMDCRLLKIKLSFEPEWLRWASEQAYKAGVALSINNHIGTVFETVSGTQEHLSKVGHHNYGLLYDPLHLMVNGEDYLGCVPKLAGLTKNILIQCVRQSVDGEKPMMECNGKGWVKALPCEAGVQNLKEVFRLFKQSGYDGMVTVIENNFSRDKREYAAAFYADYLNTLWQEV